MKRISAAIVFLFILASGPVFAADPSPQGGMAAPAGAGEMPGKAAMQARQGDQERQMMRHPQHLLMMAYHRTVANFGHVLYQATEQGETVPPILARVTVAEMRRSVEEMERQRALAVGQMQENPDRQKMMDRHLVQVKSHLRELEELVKRERVDSGEVRRHLQEMFQECEGADCEMMPGAGVGRHTHGGPGLRTMPCCDCGASVPQHGMMMQKMMQKVKRQDAELAGLVREMESASRDEKVDLLVEAVSKMVRQRADMTAEMESLLRRHAGMDSGMVEDEYEELEIEDEE